ncbi:MAG: hypothetical protein QM762_15085 [Chryseolinea sp.]
MNTRILLSASSLAMGIAGLILSFAPAEILEAAGLPYSQIASFTLQCAGGLYLGFAIMNWMSRGAMMGGIYARPLAMGNFLHFFVGAMALLKQIGGIGQYAYVVYGITVLYTVFAGCFGVALFTHPLKATGDAK